MSNPVLHEQWAETERHLRAALVFLKKYVKEERWREADEFLDNREYGLALDNMSRVEYIGEVEFWQHLTYAARVMLDPPRPKEYILKPPDDHGH